MRLFNDVLMFLNDKQFTVISQPILHYSLCQAFLGTVFTPVFPALYSCTLFRLPRECLRLVPLHFKLGSKDQEPNLKCRDDYLKLLDSFPIADE